MNSNNSIQHHSFTHSQMVISTTKNFIFSVKVGWLVWFYGMSTFVGYLMPSPFLCKYFYLNKKQFSMSTQFNGKKILFLAIQFIQTILIQLIQFSISWGFV